MTNKAFQPNWISAPGDTMVDILDENHISIVEFAHRIGQSTKKTKELLKGGATITIEIARQLEQILGASMEFWMSRDFQYHEDISRLQMLEPKWINDFPVEDMIKFGWIKPVTQLADKVTAVLNFFNTANIHEWHKKYAQLQSMAAFRTSAAFESRPEAVAVWFRQGEIESETIDCKPWNEKRFLKSLSTIKTLTRIKNPNIFIPELKRHCAENGVAVAIVRAPSGCRASGATRFLSKDKALLLLSFRHLTDDHFWFSFFHEAGHLLLHGKNGFFLEGSNVMSMDKENEANEFASNTLIPPELQPEVLNILPNYREVIAFANRAGISPGIVVGQLQHLKKIKRSQLNRLKRRFQWDD